MTIFQNHIPNSYTTPLPTYAKYRDIEQSRKLASNLDPSYEKQAQIIILATGTERPVKPFFYTECPEIAIFFFLRYFDG